MNITINEDVTRRSLMGAMGLMGATMAMGPVVAMASEGGSADYDTSSNILDYQDTPGADLPWSGPGSAAGDWVGTPEDVKHLGGCTMPLDELNRRRQLYMDSKGEYVKEDGTVVPAAYTKAMALLNTYGYGVGNDRGDNGYDAIMRDLTEDEAQAYIDMPNGVAFSPAEFATHSGYTLEDAEKYCTSLADKAWILRFTNDRGTFYTHVPAVQGVIEYHDNDTLNGWSGSGIFAPDLTEIAWQQAGSAFFAPSPVTPDVVKDGAIYPLDDLRKIWSTKSKFSLSPCTCRMWSVHEELAAGGYPNEGYDIEGIMSSECGHRIETCLSCGEEAQFWIDHGVGREITLEEAIAVLDRSVEEGFILQRTYSDEAETICSCHGDCCYVMSYWKAAWAALEGETPNPWKHIHRYDLEVDYDACVSCGACAERCPMDAISMDGEDGRPVVNDMCVRCGQCAYVCPASARILVPKPQEEWLPFTKDTIELNNRLSAQRFEAGLIW